MQSGLAPDDTSDHPPPASPAGRQSVSGNYLEVEHWSCCQQPGCGWRWRIRQSRLGGFRLCRECSARAQPCHRCGAGWRALSPRCRRAAAALPPRAHAFSNNRTGCPPHCCASCAAATGTQASAAIQSRTRAKIGSVANGIGRAIASGTLAKAVSTRESSASDNSYSQGSALSLADGTSSQALAKGVANAETNSLSYGTATSTSLGVNTYAEADAFSNAKNNSAIDVESDANDSI